ncbi:hypothetical protein [Chryseobacterium cheonjiense]|uniref:Uncharacterized protein n=1 Tax=Chryseobacterium cheonjiense TaxID=2728845 RepID=A0A7Y0A3A3_9FLAO|nr:hypothetical protein [Chryseobacterium cheonjiense]NML55849.1 hypothetical protein [Chryseobacterium cheonjiense]
MKKLIFPIVFFLSGLYSSQSNTITVKIDDSQRYIYETTLNRLRADSYKREVADAIKSHADRYFTELEKIADYFKDIDDIQKPTLQNELEKLKVYGYNILNLLQELDRNQLTGTKLKYTVEKAFSELNSTVQGQTFKELNIYKALVDVRKDVLATATDDVLFTMVQDVSGVSRIDLLRLHKSSFTHLTLRQFLIEQYEKYFLIKHKYQ